MPGSHVPSRPTAAAVAAVGLGALVASALAVGGYPSAGGLFAAQGVLLAAGVWVLRQRDAFRAAEDRYRRFFDLSDDLFAIAGHDGYFRQVSPAFTRTLGFPEAEFYARPVAEFIHPDDREATEAEILRVVAGGVPREVENRYRTAAGGYRWLQWRVAVRPDEGLSYAVARDVTDAKRAADLMEQTHRAARVGGWALDIATRRLLWTAETFRIHDTTPDEYTPTVESAIDFYAPEHRPTVTAAVRRATECGEEWSEELELVTARGRRIWVQVVGRVEFDDGRPVTALGSIQDITDRKHAELALHRANEVLESRVRERTADLEATSARLREAQTLAGIGSYRWDAATGAVEWSDELYRIYGRSPATFTPSLPEYLGCVHPDDRDRVTVVVESGRDYDHEYRLVRPGGEVRWVHARGRVTRGPDGRPSGREGVCQDITDRKTADDALRASEALNRAIIAAEPECVKVLDPGYRIETMNPAGLRMVGAERVGQVVGLHVIDYLLPEYRAGYLDAIAGAFAGRQTVTEYEFVGLGGGRRRVEQHAAPIPDPEQPGRVSRVIAVARDVTERAAAEAALRASEALNRAVLDSLTAHIAVLDRDGTVRAVNDAWVRFGRDAGNGVPAGDPADARAGLAAVLAGTAAGFRMTYPCHAAGLERWFQLVVTPLAGPVGGAVVSHTDVTDLKRAEDDARAAARENEALIKEVHHRVKNNLQIVMSLLNLQADAVADPAVLGPLRESRDRVRSMALIHESLYRADHLARLDPAGYVEDLCAGLVRSYAADPERVRLDVRAEPVALDLDRAVPVGLLLNELVSNALKHAFPDGRGGTITVGLAAGPGGTAALTVSDDGIGFPPGFDPVRRDTLGFQLVTTLTRQLDGSLELSGAGGVTARVTFRA